MSKKIEKLSECISREDLVQKYLVEDLDRKDVAEYFGISKYELAILLNFYDVRIPMSQRMRKTRKRQLAHMTPERKAEIKQKEKLTKANKSEAIIAEEIAKRVATRAKNDALDPEGRAEARKLGYERRSANLKLKPQEFWEERNRKFRNTLAKSSSYNVKKGIETKRSKGTFNSSSIQDRLTEYLKIMYPNVELEYNKDLRYPFSCDFYIPELDLFIELNGHWTHGDHPFDKNNPEDLEKLEKWKAKCSTYVSSKGTVKQNSYHTAIKVWTEVDPLKLEYAKNNNLNYVVFYNIRKFSAMNVIQHIDFDRMHGIYLWDVYEDYKDLGDYL